MSVQGSVLALLLYDVCEEIQLEDLRRIFDARTVTPSPKTAAPELVRFARPPVVEPLESLTLSGGENVNGQIKYYDYGVVSVIFELPFNGEWDTLMQLSSRWMWDPEFERRARSIVRQKLVRAAPALIKPYKKEWQSEDYFIFQLREVAGINTAVELIAKHGNQIAQIVRGETTPLSESERNEVLHSSVSYYVNDVVFVGWNSALVYDTASGAQTACELLEYANSQLLEFRHYDDLLTQELEGVYRFEKGRGALARWRLGREATRLQTLLLEVTQLTEHADNAIKFLSDMFSARLYRMASVRVGVLDYKNLVNQKLKTAEELYRFMMDQFHQGRAFVLEFIVVVILVIELFYFFRGKVI